MEKSVRVRIAPSPTGIPHIGNTRTALFNYAFAMHNKGKFIVRIEDTDQARIIPGAKEAIFEILNWLGISWDEEYTQSERKDIYKEHAESLIKKGLAYEDEGAVRFKIPIGREISWTDAIGNKKISFKTDIVEDFVILKSDGFPTYHLANVIDDHLMNISHVIRGDEWISSTPKHILLYEAFGWELPVF
ncbi:MAG: glutamate--tRNA ligase family protein, partial [Candidatus Levybacteria bacterium]|nr:glutamate--tRNA ligase family protein [Candidatus Levybacteria bacterium]